MPFHKLAIILIVVIAASGATILIGASLVKTVDLMGTGFIVVWVVALLGFVGWRIFLRYSEPDDPN